MSGASEPAIVTPEVRMAHEIARQFVSEPPEQAALTIAAHLRRFWAPSMIVAFLTEAGAGADLDPVVSRAAELLR